MNQPPHKTTRRKWLKRTLWTTLAVSTGVTVDTFFIEPHWLELLERDLPIAGLPSLWQGKTLVQISDIHVGPQVSDDYIVNSFNKVSELRPDIVAFTGDFVTSQHDGRIDRGQYQAVYRHLPHGQTATLGILGNHDYGPCFCDHAVAKWLTFDLEDRGVRMLRNDVVNIDGLEVTGLDELLAGRCDGKSAFQKSDPASARLVLCHNPDAADHDQWPGYRGWILSGHTHGGQCKPPFLPPPVIPVVNKRYTAGEFDLFDGRRMYINRGLGHNLAVRFNVRPEITVFRLVRA